jgi:phosphoserine aminotransferase
MYNALPVSSVEVLVEVMKEFGRKNGWIRRKMLRQ